MLGLDWSHPRILFTIAQTARRVIDTRQDHEDDSAADTQQDSGNLPFIKDIYAQLCYVRYINP